MDSRDGGSIIHWNGTQWSTQTSLTHSDLYSVFMVNASDGWAVGLNGTIVQWNGTLWIPEFPSSLILPLFMIATLLAVVIYKKRTLKIERLKHVRSAKVF